MEFRIVSLPPFKAASSGVDVACDFSPAGILGKFNAYFSSLELCDRDSFTPRDFLYFDNEKQGMVWILALSEDIDAGGYEVIDFPGGCYLCYAYKDGDQEANQILWNKAMAYVASQNSFELDIKPGRYAMGHIITPPEIINCQGWAQMESFIPIRPKS